MARPSHLSAPAFENLTKRLFVASADNELRCGTRGGGKPAWLDGRLKHLWPNDLWCMKRRRAAGRLRRMILLDTDHTTFLKYPDSERDRRAIDRLNAVSASEVIGVAIVTVEERMYGRLAVIAKEKSALRHVVVYPELTLLFELYGEFEIVAFEEAAARQFDDLRRQKFRIGSRDLKIAATALVNQALLLSTNGTDFRKSARLATRELAGLIDRWGRPACETNRVPVSDPRPCTDSDPIRPCA